MQRCNQRVASQSAQHFFSATDFPQSGKKDEQIALAGVGEGFTRGSQHPLFERKRGIRMVRDVEWKTRSLDVQSRDVSEVACDAFTVESRRHDHDLEIGALGLAQMSQVGS